MICRFSALGIVVCINYFLEKGHNVDHIKAFAFRNPKGGLTDQDRATVNQLVGAGLLTLVEKKHYDDL